MQVRITTFGRRLDGKDGVKGEFTADLSPSELDSQRVNARARGDDLRIDYLDQAQPLECEYLYGMQTKCPRSIYYRDGRVTSEFVEGG